MSKNKHDIGRTPPLDTPSAWYLNQANRVNASPALPVERSRTDWLVIGAGFTGLAAARRLGESCPQDRVILLDARSVGWGTSGRNSGFIIDLPHKFDLESDDLERLKSVIRLNRAAIAELDAIVRRHRIDCDWTASGKHQGAVSRRGSRMLKRFTEKLDSLGEPYCAFDRAGCEAELGTGYYARSIHTPGTVLVDPARLIRGLANALPDNVELYENSPVVDFEVQHHHVKVGVSSASGYSQITARKVVLCVNAFTSQFPFLKRRLLPISTFASITEPLSDQDAKAYVGRYDWGLTPADAGGTTLRMTRDKRLMVRNSYRYTPDYGLCGETLGQVKSDHIKALKKRYPYLKNLSVEHTWGGVCCLSANQVSFFGKLDRNIYGALCDNGVGIAKGTMAGKLMIDLACHQDSELLRDMLHITSTPRALPPDPFLGIGVRTRLGYEKWKSRHEI